MNANVCMAVCVCVQLNLLVCFLMICSPLQLRTWKMDPRKRRASERKWNKNKKWPSDHHLAHRQVTSLVSLPTEWPDTFTHTWLLRWAPKERRRERQIRCFVSLQSFKVCTTHKHQPHFFRVCSLVLSSKAN